MRGGHLGVVPSLQRSHSLHRCEERQHGVHQSEATMIVKCCPSRKIGLFPILLRIPHQVKRLMLMSSSCTFSATSDIDPVTARSARDEAVSDSVQGGDCFLAALVPMTDTGVIAHRVTPATMDHSRGITILSLADSVLAALALDRHSELSDKHNLPIVPITLPRPLCYSASTRRLCRDSAGEQASHRRKP